MWKGVKHEERKLSPTVSPVGAVTARPSGQLGITLGPICTPWNSGEDSTWRPVLIHNTYSTRYTGDKPKHTETHVCLMHTVTHTFTRETSKHRHTQHRYKYKNAYKHEFIWPNTHASTLTSTGKLGGEREKERKRERGSLMSYEESRGQRESSVLAAVQPLKCHRDRPANSWNTAQATNTHMHKYYCRAVRRCCMQSPERCIIHARATKTEWVCVDICVAACAGTTCSFWSEASNSVEVKVKGWRHTLQHFCLKTEWKIQLSINVWFSPCL